MKARSVLWFVVRLLLLWWAVQQYARKIYSINPIQQQIQSINPSDFSSPSSLTKEMPLDLPLPDICGCYLYSLISNNFILYVIILIFILKANSTYDPSMQHPALFSHSACIRTNQVRNMK